MKREKILRTDCTFTLELPEYYLYLLTKRMHYYFELQYFCLTELEEMKSCIFSVETANTGVDCNCAGIICFYVCLRRRYFLRPRKSAKHGSWRMVAIFMQFSPCILLGCELIITRGLLSKFGTWSERNETIYLYFGNGIR